VERIIISRLPQVIELKTSAFWFGVIGLTFTSTWIFSSVRTILNQIFDVKVERGFLYGLLRDIMMVLLLLILVSFATFIIPAVNIIYKLTNNTEFIQKLNISSVWNSIVYVSSLALMFGLFFALYYLIPYEKLGKKVAAMSAFWTTLLWEVARIIFGYYVNNILTSNPFYGAFVLIIAVLFWVYYSACLFIIGAEIGELYRERLALKKVN
jgi:membrane protein